MMSVLIVSMDDSDISWKSGYCCANFIYFKIDLLQLNIQLAFSD